MARKPQPADSAGVNIPPPQGEEAMILSGIAKMDELEERAVNARKAISRFRKEFAATTGIKLHVFDQARRERGLERKETVEDQMQLMRLRRYLKLPVGKQTELFPADAPVPTEDAAYLDGYARGIAGRGQRKPPEEFASGKQQQSWIQGWDEGQAKLGENFFAKKDYSKEPPPAKATKSEGPSGKKLVDPKAEKAAKGAAAAGEADAGDNVVQLKSKPPATPAPKEDTATKAVKSVAAKKKAEKAAKAPTKAAEAAAGGGVGGLAPPGARKGGGDFEDDPPAKPAPAKAEEDDDLDLDLDLDDDDDISGEGDEDLDDEGVD